MKKARKEPSPEQLDSLRRQIQAGYSPMPVQKVVEIQPPQQTSSSELPPAVEKASKPNARINCRSGAQPKTISLARVRRPGGRGVTGSDGPVHGLPTECRRVRGEDGLPFRAVIAQCLKIVDTFRDEYQNVFANLGKLEIWR